MVGGSNEGSEVDFFSGSTVSARPARKVAVFNFQKSGVGKLRIVRVVVLPESDDVQANTEAIKHVAECLDGAGGFGGGAVDGAIDGNGGNKEEAPISGGLAVESVKYDSFSIGSAGSTGGVRSVGEGKARRSHERAFRGEEWSALDQRFSPPQ